MDLTVKEVFFLTDNELLMLIHRVDKLYHEEYHKAVRLEDDSEIRGHGRILRELDHHDGMTQKALAEHMRIRPQSLTDALMRIEKLGYIERKRREKDRREVLVTITESGRERSMMFKRISDEVICEMFSCLDREEKERLGELLEKLVKPSQQNGR